MGTSGRRTAQLISESALRLLAKGGWDGAEAPEANGQGHNRAGR